MLTKLAELAIRWPRRVLAGAVVFAVAAAAFGLPVMSKLLAGGYDVPNSEFARAEEVLADEFDAGGFALIFTVTDPAGADSAQARQRGQDIASALQASPHARSTLSYWSAPPRMAEFLVASDGQTGLVAAQIAGNDRDAPNRAYELAEPFIGTHDGVTVAAGGEAIAQYELNHQSRIDLIRLEMIAAPFIFIALVWIFGSVVAAMVPLIVSGFAIVATMATLRVLFQFTDVAVFAINLSTALCLALAVDYALFIVSRYREEVAAGQTREKALVRALGTAGRTVVYSMLTVAVITATMLVFPIYFLRSLAYAGLAGVTFSLVGSLLVAPALLMVLGDRVDALDVRKPLRRWFNRPDPQPKRPEEQFWYRVARFAMRRAVPVVVIVVGVILVLGSPLLGARLGYPDDRVLPESTSSRQVGDLLRSQFSAGQLGVVHIVLPEGYGSPKALTDYAIELSKVDNVTGVAAPSGIYVEGSVVSPVTVDSQMTADAAYLTVTTDLDPLSTEGAAQIGELKDVVAPGEVLFSGLAQRGIDNTAGIEQRLPWVLAMIAAATMVIIFMMTGSILLPVKALLMNLLSLIAGFGVMTWIFQDGHLGGFGTVATGYYNYTIPPLLLVLAYGLSMDYEVFVLSCMREEWVKSDRSSAANERAVALGLAHTGRLVTAAATVMAVVFLSIATAEVSFMRGLGIGLALTVLLDAFVVRPLLVPAFMRLFGRLNWWAPEPLARWHDKRGFTEGESIPVMSGARGLDPDGEPFVRT
ncbi:MMPL family transporter [Rhodococcus sp. NPDC003318]|uniref:MMPL family transporter n=1 Tax=Rhodococcus sp. NPDC003318 TaxID=3364503 RepID=UPI0036953828